MRRLLALPIAFLLVGCAVTKNINITTRPPDASIKIDGVDRGKGRVMAPIVFKDKKEIHNVVVSRLGYKEQTGVVITQVERGSAAEEAGLRRGMLVQKVDKVAVQNATTFKEQMDKAAMDKGVLLQVYSVQGGTGFIVLKAEQPAAKQ